MQTRLGSFIEAWINIIIGCGVAYTANLLVFPLLGLPLSHSQNITLVMIMTVISFLRSYLLRRFFNKLRLFTYAAREVREEKEQGRQANEDRDDGVGLQRSAE